MQALFKCLKFQSDKINDWSIN